MMRIIILLSTLSLIFSNTIVASSIKGSYSGTHIYPNDLTVTKYKEFESFDLNKNEIHSNYLISAIDSDCTFEISDSDIFRIVESELIKYGLFLIKNDLDKKHHSSTIKNFKFSDMGLLGIRLLVYYPHSAHIIIDYTRVLNNDDGKTMFSTTYLRDKVIQKVHSILSKTEIVEELKILVNTFAVDYIKSNKSVAKKALD